MKLLNFCLSKSKYQKDHRWDQWFAGLIDGGGYFYISKTNEISFEFTTHIYDARIVYDIKNKLKAGSVKLRNGTNKIRYRVKQRSIVIHIVHRINGKLHNSKRCEQLKKVCQLLNITYLSPVDLIAKKDSYLSGLFDDHGTITISISKTTQPDSQKPKLEGKITRLTHSKESNQLGIKITSKDYHNCSLIQQSYGFGKIFVERSPLKNGKIRKPKYHWTITSYEDGVLFYEYLKKNPLKSVKMHRIRLSLHYFHYKRLKYHLKAVDTLEYKIWSKFCRSWFKYMV